MSTVSTIDFDRMFEGRRVPGWLRRFETEPDNAIHDLLLGWADLGHLNAADPEEILLDWLEGLGSTHPEFLHAVDSAIACWIRRSWGKPTLPVAGGNAAVVASAWVRVANIIAYSPGLTRAAKALRSFLPEQRIFLSALSEGRARDPEGRAWLALARHQEGRPLLEEWWRLCSLAPDVPWYHGEYGIQGLRELQTEGMFPLEVAEGLARLAFALAERVEEGWLEPKTAQEEFERTARLTMASYPYDNKWTSFWQHVLQDKRVQTENVRSWIEGLSPQEPRDFGEPSRNTVRHWPESDHDWPLRAQEIADHLGQGDGEWLDRANQLLLEQGRFAEATGKTFFVVRSACNFAGRVRKSRPELAWKWANLARRYDPWHAFAWTTMAAALLCLHRLEEALEISLKAVRRFPQDVVARNGLGEVLKAQGRLEDAERLSRETVARFPEDELARRSLEGILRAREGGSRVAFEIREPSMIYGGERRLRTTDMEFLFQDAYLLRRWGGRSGPTGELRERARKTLELLAAKERQDSEITGEIGLLEIESGELERALDLLREAVKRFPGSARVRYALARADREAAARRGSLDPKRPEAPVLSWRRLGRMDEHFRPLQFLGEGRTWLAQMDGSIVADNARACLGSLGYWIQTQKRGEEALRASGARDESSGFVSWWVNEIQRQVFGVVPIAREEDIEDLGSIQERLQTDAAVLNQLEEDWINQWARA